MYSPWSQLGYMLGAMMSEVPQAVNVLSGGEANEYKNDEAQGNTPMPRNLFWK